MKEYLKIIQESKAAGLHAREFKYDMSGFMITFHRTKEKSSGKILNLIKANRDITIPELAEKLNISTRAIEKQLRSLQFDEKLERIGRPNGGYWNVIERTETKL